MRCYTAGLVLVLVFVHLQQCTEGANILGVFPMAGKSLNILHQRLFKGLADVGHHVTIISPYEFEFDTVNGSVSEVILTGYAEEFESMMSDKINIMNVESTNLFESNFYLDILLELYNNTYHHPNVRSFLSSNPKFDAVITEHISSESLMGFAAFFNCPSIVFSSIGGVNPFVNDMVGNPMPPSYIPHTYLLGDYSKGLNFFDRFTNFLFYFYDLTIFNYFYSFPAHNRILKSVFPKNFPDAAKLYHNVSLVLLGSHSSIRQATPLVPNVLEIGGFHTDPPKKLPKDLQDFLDAAENGAIYFSMGSIIQSKDFSNDRKKIFLNVFKKLNMKVIWKFEDTTLPGKPSNVLIKKWLTQMDILAHPNIKLFITHGGHGSVQETIYHGVPALMIPLFLDQFNNAYKAQEQGYALKLSYDDMNFNEETLYTLIKELLENPKYRENAKVRSEFFHDRPMKPLDTAIYWIEYVIRHKGANHLKVAAVKMPLYQLYMLDVLLFITVIFSLVILGFFACFSKFCRKESNQKIKKSN